MRSSLAVAPVVGVSVPCGPRRGHPRTNRGGHCSSAGSWRTRIRSLVDQKHIQIIILHRFSTLKYI